MGKKKLRSKTSSRGERRSSYGVRDSADKRMQNKLDALAKGKDVTFTVPNPNKNETNRPFIKYRVSGKAYLDALKNPEKKGSSLALSNGSGN